MICQNCAFLLVAWRYVRPMLPLNPNMGTSSWQNKPTYKIVWRITCLIATNRDSGYVPQKFLVNRRILCFSPIFSQQDYDELSFVMTLAMTLGRGGLGLPWRANHYKEACGTLGPISKDPWTRATGWQKNPHSLPQGTSLQGQICIASKVPEGHLTARRYHVLHPHYHRIHYQMPSNC